MTGELAPISPGEFLFYQTEDGQTRVEVRIQDETVWLSQKGMAELFGKDVRTVQEHIRNIFDEGELRPDSTIRKFRIVQTEGPRRVEREVEHYNLDMIISVGYRVKSLRGTQFRIWATQRLREYIVKGFAMDDERLKRAGGGNYFEELLARIRDIRSSERVFWRKVLNIYATSIDYDPRAQTSHLFFQTVQNKMHWAIHGQTAAEVIARRADATRPHMGLTHWAGEHPRKTDIVIAKNYLKEDEIKALNLVVSAYLDFAELQALNRKPMAMRDWIAKLDDFLRLSERPILTGAGTVTHEEALAKATAQFEAFHQAQASLPQSVDRHFDKAVAEVKLLESKRPRGRKRNDKRAKGKIKEQKCRDNKEGS